MEKQIKKNPLNDYMIIECSVKFYRADKVIYQQRNIVSRNGDKQSNNIEMD